MDKNCFSPGPKPAFGEDLENELYNLVIELLKRGYGLSKKKGTQLSRKIDSLNEVKVVKNVES